MVTDEVSDVDPRCRSGSVVLSWIHGALAGLGRQHGYAVCFEEASLVELDVKEVLLNKRRAQTAQTTLRSALARRQVPPKDFVYAVFSRANDTSLRASSAQVRR